MKILIILIIYLSKKKDEVLPWKKFNNNMAVSVEYNLNYE